MTMSALEAMESMADLERNTPEEVKRSRSHARITVRAKVTAQPANSSERSRFELPGILGNISRGGCLILFTGPLGVGDIYRLSFDRSMLDLEPVFARCLRCRLLREDAFEAGFSFFQPIVLPGFGERDQHDLFD
jgi:hypothetical protein